ncbi:hypothetical protein Prudu_1438S000100 [Prunus dulcis]|uniref:Uncharacterized protein n=1 Tax=Prunus dulcis TaxID=3755 RepID=A0A5H2Y8E1_PRUDU|nr:hypothetical protein Prudu_1438S000100 [Prunus dulcis]
MCLMSEEGCDVLSETQKVAGEVEVAEGWTSNNEVGGSSSQTQYMKDHKRVRCKGRSKGVTGAKEKAMKRGIRHCRSVDTLVMIEDNPSLEHTVNANTICNSMTSPSTNDESTPIHRSDPLFDDFDRMHGPTE